MTFHLSVIIGLQVIILWFSGMAYFEQRTNARRLVKILRHQEDKARGRPFGEMKE
jgi:uncharacterized iron-regulated membrane protein